MKSFPHPQLPKVSRNHRTVVFSLLLLLFLLVGAALATSAANASGKPLRLYAAEKASQLMTRYSTTRARLATYFAALTVTNGRSGSQAGGIENKGVMTARNSATGASRSVPFNEAVFVCPTSFTVADLGDAVDATPGDQICATAGGVCTLRAAIQEANAITACSPLTINFNVTGTITLGSALPAIAHPNLTITGPGASSLTVSGNNLYRVLSIASGSYNVSISGLTLTNGYFKANDTTAVSGSNSAPVGSGGGLYSLSTGTVNVTDCVITNNTAQGGNATGGTNEFGGEGQGAGIYLLGGTAKLTRCTISNNSALGGLGMGGTTQTLDGTGKGAGVFKQSGSLTVEDCTIADNIVDRIAGSVLSSFSQAQGGGLYNNSGALAVTGSTFSGNRRPNTLTLAGAAIANQANNITWTLTNCTFSGNTGSNTIAHIPTNGTLTMVNCTVANNTLATGNAAAGAIFNQGFGPNLSTLNLKNTVLGNNTDGPNIRKFGTVTSQGNNFDSDGTTGFTDGVNGDIVGTSGSKKDPKLSTLGNHGGLTKTQVPLPGSQLLDAGTSSGAPATDQRGIARPQGSAYDIGAVEAQTFALALVGGNNQNTTVGTQFPTALQVNLKEGTNNIQGAPISYVAPGGVGVASTSPTSNTATTDASGNASITATANTVAGSYNVSAFIGTLVQQFALTNNPGAATNFVVSAPPLATLGSPFNFTVTAKDAFGNTTTGYSGTVHFTSSDAVASLPANSTLTNGMGTFNATLNTINNQTITATDTVSSAITGTSNNIFVSLGTCPTTFTVNDLSDTPDANLGNGICADASGNCTLRAAIQEANAITACTPLTINFNVTLPNTIMLGSDLPTIAHPNLTITGPGANQLTVSGASMYRPFNIGSGNYAVTISGLTVANGRGNGGGGLINFSTGEVNLNNLTFDSNAITGSSGGGGVRHASNGTLNVTGSTFINNNSTGTGGGGINNFSTNGTVNVTNSTFSGNLANLGGGIHTQSSGITNITNCTLVSNGGGIRNNSGTVTVKNTIAVGNGTDLSGTVTETTNLTGTLASALLSALGNHGGTTQTFALLPGSPAINAGTSSGAPTTDQRGIARPQQSGVDIGAFESRGFSMTVNGGNNQSTNVNTLFASPLSVRVTSSNGEPVNGGQVTFTPPGMGESATIAGNPATISSEVATTGNVTANGTVGGPYLVAAAANGVATGVDFSLTNTNPAPTIMAGSALSRQQGAAAINSTIATVNDANQSAGTLNVTTVTVPTGIVITNILNTNGTITADVAANCLAKLGPNTVTLQVSDAFGAMAAMPASLTVNVMAAPLPTLSIDDVTVVEGNSGTVSAVFTVTLTGVLNYCPTVTVNYATADDTATLGDNDYQNTVGMLTFNPPYGSNVVTQIITVPVVGDTDFEGTERFFVNLSSPSNAKIQKGEGIGTITDDDLQPADIKAQIGDPALCLTAGGLVGITATVTNPNAVAVNADFTATLPASLNGLPGTGLASINPAGITVTNSMVTWTGTIPANTTLIITYKAQIVPGTPPGQPICVVSDVVFNNGPAAQIQECTVLNCPANGVVKVSDQKPGSLLVFPYYTSKAAEKKDTRMTISNVSNQPVTAHVFFIDGATCQQADQFLCLSPYASFAFKSSEYDPEATGWLLVVAVAAMGRPVQANSLIGNAFVVDGEYVDNYGAEAFRANSPLLATLTADTATLFFDNQSYDAVPNQFAVEVQSPLDAAQQRVITVGLQGDLTTSTIRGAGQVGPGFVINGNEKPMGSFIGWLNGNCQAQTVISTTTPRVPSGMNGVIPKGQVGTLQWRIGAGVGLLLTPRNTPWSGIRTLHKTGSTATTLTIPLYRPVC